MRDHCNSYYSFKTMGSNLQWPDMTTNTHGEYQANNLRAISAFTRSIHM